MALYPPATISGTNESIVYYSGTVPVTNDPNFIYDYTYGGIEGQKQGSYIALAPFISGSGGQSYTSGSPPQEENFGQLWFHKKAGRYMLNVQGPYGHDQTIGSHFGQDRIVIYQGNTNSNTVTTIGQIAPVVTGAYAAATIATTNFSSSLRRTDISTGATAGSSAGIYGAAAAYWVGNAPGLGGWFQQTRCIVAVTAAFGAITNTRFFCGMSSSITAPTNVPIGPKGGVYGVCVETTGTTYQFVASTGTSPTYVNTGISMSLGDVMDIRTYCPPSGSVIYMSCQKLNPTGSTILAEWAVSSTMPNFPANTTLFNNYVFIQTATSSTVRLGLMQYYLDTDY